MGEAGDKLRVALLSYRGNMFCGGQGVYVTQMARALCRRGHRVMVFSGPPYPEPMPGVELLRVPDENFIVRPARHLPSSPLAVFRPLTFLEYGLARAGMNPEMLAFSLRVFSRLRSLSAAEKIDVVHDNQGLGYGLLLIRALGLPVVATIHHPLQVDRMEDLRQMWGLFRQGRRALYYPLVMQRVVARRVDQVIAVSHFSSRLVTHAYGLDPSRVAVIGNGVDPETFRPLSELRREPGRLLFVGSTEDRKKGILYLLRALSALPPTFHLVIVDGRRYAGRVYAADLVGRLGLTGRVTFLDKISTAVLVQEYNRAEMMVMPSLFEGFGLPALEAMACATPLVCTTAGALPEVVDGKCAALIPPGREKAILEAVLKLHADPQVRKQMGEAGRQRALSRFSWDRAAEELETIYRRIRKNPFPTARSRQDRPHE